MKYIKKNQIDEIGPILKKLSWKNSKVRSMIQEWGVEIVPLHFYSCIPSIEEIEQSFEYNEKDPVYFDKRYKVDKMIGFLDKISKYKSEFNPSVNSINTNKFQWNNDYYSYSDAMILYCMIRHIKPNNIFEIGSGCSTLIALEAIGKNKNGSITCIDPYCKLTNIKNKLNIIRQKKQEVDNSIIHKVIRKNDIIFIDSTHSVKVGSDCLDIYLRLLPNLKQDVYIQIHDIYLPYPYPKKMMLDNQVYWTEQYLLQAFISNNNKVDIVLPVNYLNKNKKQVLKKIMDNKYEEGGAGYWIKYRGAE